VYHAHRPSAWRALTLARAEWLEANEGVSSSLVRACLWISGDVHTDRTSAVLASSPNRHGTVHWLGEPRYLQLLCLRHDRKQHHAAGELAHVVAHIVSYNIADDGAYACAERERWALRSVWWDGLQGRDDLRESPCHEFTSADAGELIRDAGIAVDVHRRVRAVLLPVPLSTSSFWADNIFGVDVVLPTCSHAFVRSSNVQETQLQRSSLHSVFHSEGFE
jgi:hypothetical protein